MNTKDLKMMTTALLTLNKVLTQLASTLPHTAKEQTKKATVSKLAKAVKPNKSFCKNRDYSPYASVRVSAGGRPEVQPRVNERMSHMVNLLAACPDKKADIFTLNENMLAGTKCIHLDYTVRRAEKFGIVNVIRRGSGGYNTVSLTPGWRRNAIAKGII